MGAFLQFAMMYTNGRGERRIRVINYKYEVTNNLEKIYDSIDYLTTANVKCYLFSYWLETMLIDCLNLIK